MHGLLYRIGERHKETYYGDLVLHGQVHGLKIPSMQELFGVSLDDSTPGFDEATDATLDDYAMRRLKERQLANGG